MIVVVYMVVAVCDCCCIYGCAFMWLLLWLCKAAQGCI